MTAESRLQEDVIAIKCDRRSSPRAGACLVNRADSRHYLSESGLSLFSQSDTSDSWVALYK